MLALIEHLGGIVAVAGSIISAAIAAPEIRQLQAKTGSKSVVLSILSGQIFHR